MTTPLPTADGRRTRRALAGLVRAHIRGFSFAVAALLAGAVAAVASPLVLGGIVDAVTAGDGGGLRALLIVLVAVVVLQAATAAWSRVAVTRVGERMLAQLRTQLVERVLRLPERRVEAAGRGEVVARVSGDVAVVGETVSSVVPAAASATFSIAVAAAGLGVIDLRLTLAACLALPVQLFALRHYLRRSQPVYRASREAVGVRSQRVVEALEARPTLVAFGTAAQAEERIDESAREAAELTMQATRLGVRFWGRLNFAEFVGLASILVVGFLLVTIGAISIGSATAGALIFMQLFGPIGMVLGGVDDLQRAAASLARLVGVLDEPSEQTGPDSADERDESRSADAAFPVEANGLVFRYGEREVLREVSLTVPPAEHVAIVGASGAGKSTLAALIAGRLVPAAGEIGFGGGTHPIVTLVTQENHVFSGTLRDDLRLALPAATDDELREALTAVGADTWADRLEDGLDTPVGAGGHQLGDVQRQQLALARVHLQNPDVLLLDEAASEAGSADGDALDRAAARLAAARTTVTIAHRLEQARAASRIVVMDDGRIIETGSHDDLIARDGEYARFWRASHT